MRLCLTRILRITSIIIIFTCIASLAHADFVKLKDGTVLQGKVIKESDKIYFFTNAFGTFDVEKKNIVNLYLTNSYIEDWKLNTKHKFNLEKEIIEENYKAGMRKKMLMGDEAFDPEKAMQNKEMKNKIKKKQKYFEHWDYGRLCISASYFTTISSEVAGSSTVNTMLPSGFSAQLAYEQGLDKLVEIALRRKNKKEKTKELIKNKDNKDKKNKKGAKQYRKTKQRPMLLPGLRLEWSYMYFTKTLFVDNEREVSGVIGSAGLMWSFPSPHNVWGTFVLAGMPGYTFLRIFNRTLGKHKDNYTFAFTAIFGYEYAIKQKVALAVHARYTYIKDKYIAFHGIGVTFGVSIRLW